jgi:hypothetical protein
MKFIGTIITLLATVVFSNFLHASEKTTIYIEVVGNEKFDVIYHRATSNATGMAMAGLLGAGIQSGVESSKDATKTKEIEPMIEAESWKLHFLNTINTSLESKNYEVEWIDSKKSKKISEGLVLKIYPTSFGIKISDTATLLMCAYADFNATLTNADKKEKEGKKKNFHIIGKDQKTYENFTSDKALLNSEVQAALTMAAKRIANKIIYNKGV